MGLISNKSVRAGDYPLFPIEELQLAIVDASVEYCSVKGIHGHSYCEYHCEVHTTKVQCSSLAYECNDKTFFDRSELPCTYCGMDPNSGSDKYKHFWPNAGKPISRLVHLETPVEITDTIPINHDWGRQVRKRETPILIEFFRNDDDADIWVKWVQSQHKVIRVS